MCPWQRRADKYGGLPFLAWIMRKPKPFGKEDKTGCSEQGVMQRLQIQEGKYPMRTKENKDLPGSSRSNASCTIRLIKDTCTACQTVIGDAFFGSVLVAVFLMVNYGIACIMNVKNCSKGYPKTWADAKLKGCSSGSYVVLAATITAKKISDGTEVAVKLLAVSYRYARSKKVQHFICTSGNVTLGRPYLAKFKDAFSNTVCRPVNRPDVIAIFYWLANQIDLINQHRQDTLGHLKKWITHCAWTRLFAYNIGTVVVNGFKMYSTLSTSQQQ